MRKKTKLKTKNVFGECTLKNCKKSVGTTVWSVNVRKYEIFENIKFKATHAHRECRQTCLKSTDI